MKNKIWRVLLSIVTLIFSVLSTMIGYGFMISADISFLEKFGYGFVLMVTPVLVVQMIIQVFKKTPPKKEKAVSDITPEDEKWIEEELALEEEEESGQAVKEI